MEWARDALEIWLCDLLCQRKQVQEASGQAHKPIRSEQVQRVPGAEYQAVGQVSTNSRTWHVHFTAWFLCCLWLGTNTFVCWLSSTWISRQTMSRSMWRVSGSRKDTNTGWSVRREASSLCPFVSSDMCRRIRMAVTKVVRMGQTQVGRWSTGLDPLMWGSV